jgi:hypothetical protein
VLAHRARRSDLVAEHAIDARGGADELDEHLGFSRLAERRPQRRDEDQGLDRVGSPPGRTVLAAVTGRWPQGPAGPRCRAARRKSSSRWRTISCRRYQCIDVGPSPGDPCSPVSPPPGRARGKVTAWMFFRRRDHRHGRAPWPGPHRGPAGRAAGPRASDARAGPSAGGYGSAALCLISSAGHPIPREAGGGQPALVARLFGKPYGFPPAQGITRRCLPGGIFRGGHWHEGAARSAGVRCHGIRPSCRARAAASVRLAAPSLPRRWVTCF